jgi:hypothetical protein
MWNLVTGDGSFGKKSSKESDEVKVHTPVTGMYAELD